MDLKCRNLDCKHNNTYACMCRHIEVSNLCNCATYEKDMNPKKEQMQDASRDMFKKEPEVHPYRHNKTIDIKCDADCLFNKDTQCIANGICVQNCPNKAVCITYIKP